MTQKGKILRVRSPSERRYFLIVQDEQQQVGQDKQQLNQKKQQVNSKKQQVGQD